MKYTVLVHVVKISIRCGLQARQPPSQAHPKMLLSFEEVNNGTRLPILYIPFAITAIRCATCSIGTQTIRIVYAGATDITFTWIEKDTVGRHRCTLREHFAIRCCKESLRAILKRTNEEATQAARTAVIIKNFIEFRVMKAASSKVCWLVVVGRTVSD